jgi:KDO2-lipid IV(A) lauroyltransferase
MTATYRGSGHPGEPVDRNPGAAARIPVDPRPERWRLKLTAALWLGAWEIARRLPEGVVYRIADGVALLLHRIAPQARARVRRNFARVVGPAELDRTVREAFRSYARYWAEAFRAADIAPDEVDARTTAENWDIIDTALDRGQGVVVLLAHHGSWDTAARWAETKGYHLAVVAEVVRPRALFAKFVALREAIGMEVVPLQRGASVTARLVEVAKANHFIGLLTDRDLTGKAPVVEFFGEATRMPVGAVVLSRRSGAPIIPIAMLQHPDRRWHIKVHQPVPVDDVELAVAAQHVAHAIEDVIRDAPEQWHAFQPIWLADLPAHRRGDWQPGDGTPA